jgi:hypothetical protein
MSSSLRVRVTVLSAIVILAVAGSVFAVLHAVAKDPVSQRREVSASTTASAPAFPTGPRLLFRSTDPESYGLVAAVPLDDPSATPVVTELECERVYANATNGICLRADRGVVTSFHEQLLDANLEKTRELTLAGSPSRARVSPDGRYAASTVFVTGHAYVASFSTATTMYDVTAGRDLGNLENWRIMRDGKPYRAVDINVWGVSFTPDSRGFYVTVASKGKTWLSRGDIASRTITTTDVQAECPSVSPDGRYVAFKRTTGRAGDWRIWVRNLSAGQEHRLGGKVNVDDQVEWLDEGHVIYGLERSGSAATDLWSAALDGSAPTRLRENAWSPAIIR